MSLPETQRPCQGSPVKAAKEDGQRGRIADPPINQQNRKVADRLTRNPPLAVVWVCRVQFVWMGAEVVCCCCCVLRVLSVRTAEVAHACGCTTWYTAAGVADGTQSGTHNRVCVCVCVCVFICTVLALGLDVCSFVCTQQRQKRQPSCSKRTSVNII